MVTLLDTESEGRMFLFATPQTLAIARKVSERTGVIDGWQMASMFSWLRPNDLVWNYWVNNYLLGQDPPAFDILAWNADTTRLTSAFHHQLLEMVAGDELVHPGALTVLGTPIDLSRITGDTYVAAGRTDHITPWHTCYRSTQLVSGHAEFVLCSSGHIQTVVADPKHRGLGYFLNPETPPDAEQWLKGAQRHEGSWWDHWVTWLSERSGDRVAAPEAAGQQPLPADGASPRHLHISVTHKLSGVLLVGHAQHVQDLGIDLLHIRPVGTLPTPWAGTAGERVGRRPISRCRSYAEGLSSRQGLHLSHANAGNRSGVIVQHRS